LCADPYSHDRRKGFAIRSVIVWISLALVTSLLAQLVVVRPIPSPRPPPLVRQQYQPVRPSPAHVWINGHWAPDADGFAWRPGRWTQPPRDDLAWEPTRWDDRGGRWVYLPGHFRSKRRFDPRTPVLPIPAPRGAPPPPPPLVEQHEAPPHPSAIWLDGQWWHDGVDFLWIAGRWSARP